MKCHVTSSAVLLMGLMPAFALGQSDGDGSQVGPHYEHLKDLECFVGNWKVEGEMKTEFEPLARLAGGKMVRFVSYQWMTNKNYLVVTYKEKPRSSSDYIAVIGWDPEKKQIRSWDFNGQGAHLQYVHTKTKKGWAVDGTSIYPGGVKGKYRGVFEMIDDDTFASSGKGTMVVDGKEVEVSLSLTAVRREPRKK